MTKYMKQRIAVDAIQFTGDNIEEIKEFVNKPYLNTSVDAVLKADGDYRENTHIHIPTLEGMMTVNYGDYIIKGMDGEFYSCKSHIFDTRYKMVEE